MRERRFTLIDMLSPRAGTSRSMRERGFTLIEMLVAVAIAMMMLALGVQLTQAARPFALGSALTRFDAELRYAQAIASAQGAATLVFAPVTPGPQTLLMLYGGSPDSATQPAPIAPESLGVPVIEATLGAAPFGFVIDAQGSATSLALPANWQPGSPLAQSTAAPCPAAGGFVLTFGAGAASATRQLSCPQAAFGSPTPIGTVPP